MKTTTTYQKNYVEVNCRYICKKCGNRMYRKNRDYFTMSPFNKKTYQENYQGLREKLNTKERPCSKCGHNMVPR